MPIHYPFPKSLYTNTTNQQHDKATNENHNTAPLLGVLFFSLFSWSCSYIMHKKPVLNTHYYLTPSEEIVKISINNY